MIDESNNKMYYKKYIHTTEWKALRKEALERDLHRCRLCNSTEKLNVHHRVYPIDGWQNDNVDNLTTLCNSCHAKFHDKMEFENSIRDTIKNSMLVWNAKCVRDNDGHLSHFVPGEISILKNHPNHSKSESKKYQYSLFACESRYKDMCFDQRKLQVFLEFAHLILVYKFDPFVVHKEFMKLSEYCDGLSDEIIYEYKELLSSNYLEERGL